MYTQAYHNVCRNESISLVRIGVRNSGLIVEEGDRESRGSCCKCVLKWHKRSRSTTGYRTFSNAKRPKLKSTVHQLFSWLQKKTHTHINVRTSHLDWVKMVYLKAGASGIVTLAIDATILRYHIAMVSITEGSTSFLCLRDPQQVLFQPPSGIY